MFEQKIEEIKDVLLERTIGNRQTVSLGQIYASEIPDSLKQFFTVDIGIWIVEERERLLNSPHFDYSDDSIVRMFEDFLRDSKNNATFSKSEYTEALDKHVKWLFNYICRPQYTLKKHVYGENDTVVSEHIVESIQVFWDYEYYRLIIEDYLKTKSIRTLSADKFDTLLGVIDNELVRNLDSRKLAHLTKPIFSMFNFGMDHTAELAPIEALSVFFADKNLTDIVDRLDEEKENRSQISLHDLVLLLGKTDYSISTDIGALFHHHADKLEKEVPADPTNVSDNVIPDIKEETPVVSRDEGMLVQDVHEIVLKEDVITEPENTGTSSENFFSAVTDSPLSIGIEQQIIPEVPTSAESPMVEAKPEKDIYIEDDIPVKSIDLEDPEQMDIYIEDHDDRGTFSAVQLESTIAEEEGGDLEQRTDRVFSDSDLYVTVDEQHVPEFVISEMEFPKKPEEKDQINDDSELLEVKGAQYVLQETADIRSTINPKNKRKYVKKIFRKNEAEYETAIDTLSRAQNWRAASAFLDELFLQNNVDMYSRIAVKFTDEIYKRYLPKTS